MSSSLDLQILPILRHEGEIYADVPGLHTAQPPRRANRRRASEHLILHLTLEGNAPLSPNANQQLLKGLAGVYYKAAGSATSALQEVTVALNNYLRDRNMRGASRGLRAVGLLTQIVLRGNTVYIAQSGPSHLFVIEPGQAVDYHDPKMSGRGLGTSRIPQVRLHQETLTENDLLLITPAPPPTWSEATLKNLSRMQPNSRYHRLLHRLEEDVNAILVMPQKGSGEVRVLRPQLGEDQEGERVEAPAPVGEPTLVERARSAMAPIGDRFGKSDPGQESPPAHRPPSPGPAPREARPPQTPPVEKKSPLAPLMDKVRQLPLGNILRRIGRGLAVVFGVVGRFLGSARDLVVKVAKQTLPDEEMLGFPAWLPGLIAVAVPIMMVVFGSVVYAERKEASYFSDSYGQAEEKAEAAANAEDPAEKYRFLEEAFAALEAAHVYSHTDESEALYENIKRELDELDNVTRLVYEPLLAVGLGNDVRISEIVIDAYNDLYLLDEISGRVIRLVSSNGYQRDEGFRCGPVPLGHIKVGPLVDIVPLAPNRDDNAVILGIDDSHTMILCTQQGGESNSIFRDETYNLPKGGVAAMTISSGDLGDVYILAPDEQLVLVEHWQEGYKTGAEYFGEGDSTPAAEAVDLAANAGKLFLLHKDGSMAECTKQGAGVVPICDSPLSFVDTRPGRSSGSVMEGASFTRIMYEAQLGTKMYILDSEDQAVYAFNAGMEYLEQFRPSSPLPGGEVTAFAVHRHNEIFLVVGGQVYWGEMGGGG